MIKEKKKVITDKKALDEIYLSYLKSEIEKGKKNIREGNVMTLEELKEFIDGLGARHEADSVTKSTR